MSNSPRCRLSGSPRALLGPLATRMPFDRGTVPIKGLGGTAEQIPSGTRHHPIPKLAGCVGHPPACGRLVHTAVGATRVRLLIPMPPPGHCGKSGGLWRGHHWGLPSQNGPMLAYDSRPRAEARMHGEYGR